MKNGEIIKNEGLKGDYFKLVFHAPEICAATCPGQFVHVKIAKLKHRILRRPFSICDVNEKGELSVVYKVVGEGTEALSRLSAGAVCDLMGPRGNPFSLPEKDEIPVIVAGGYGSAATYILARRSKNKGILLLGARGSEDLILADEFRELSFEVRTSTEDGSDGQKGLVTSLLEDVISEKEGRYRFYGCGPQGMLMAMGKILTANGLDGELSLDHLMCCGVGACFACVIKVIDKENAEGWRYARTCREGPVFKASEVYYE